MTLRRAEWLVCIGVPLATLVVAAGGIMAVAGTPWAWHVVVHEDGVRTLEQTVFYFAHATRELLPDSVLALAVAGVIRYFLPPDPRLPAAAATRRRLAIATLGTLALILGGTAWTEGPHAILENLAQQHTRPGVPLAWGAHWRYHLLELAALGLLAFALVGADWLARGRPGIDRRTGTRAMLRTTVVLFVGLTLAFRPTLEPFTDARFLGHEARELLTHTLVTLPLAIGVCLSLSHRLASPRGDTTVAAWPIVACGIGATALAGYLLVASLVTGAATAGQSDSLAALLFPHFAEHTLGYVLVPAMAGLFTVWPAPAGRPGSTS